MTAMPLLPLHMNAATVFPTIPAVVIETLGIVFGGPVSIVGFDFFAGKPYGWWGASLLLSGGAGISALLSIFSLISSESGFPARGSFTPRFSLAGKLSGSGLPVAVGEPLVTCLGNTVCWGSEVLREALVCLDFAHTMQTTQCRLSWRARRSAGIDFSSGGSGAKTKYLFFCARDGDCPSGYKCLAGKGLKNPGGICGSVAW